MQTDTGESIVRLIAPLLMAIAGAIIGWVGRRLFELRVLRAVPLDAELVAAKWEGDFDEPDAAGIIKKVAIELDLSSVWRRVSGTMKYENRTLTCSGGFYQSRILTLHYFTTKVIALQSGAIVVQLNGEGDRLEGFYTGYGPASQKLVSGKISLKRKP